MNVPGSASCQVHHQSNIELPRPSIVNVDNFTAKEYIYVYVYTNRSEQWSAIYDYCS